MTNVYIVDGARTAFTEFGGSFAKVDATELGTATAIEALKRSNVKPEQVDHVIYGNVIHTGKNSAYIARHIGLKAGVPARSSCTDIEPTMRIRYASCSIQRHNIFYWGKQILF